MTVDSGGGHVGGFGTGTYAGGLATGPPTGFSPPCAPLMHPLHAPAALAALLALSTPSAAQAFGSSPERLLVRAADADRSGDVTGAEWSSFLDALPANEGGDYDRLIVVARALVPRLDADDDGDFDHLDVEARLASMDADGSGNLDANEFANASSYRQGGGMTTGLVAFAADTDLSNTVEASEWTALLQAAGEGGVALPTLAAWLQHAQANLPEDRGAFTPATYVITLAAGLDVDRNGVVERADFDRIFQSLDADGNGAVAGEELRPARGSRATSTATPEPRAATIVAGPPLMPWQRSLEDALILSKATKKPLLLCVNMDGETASEALARRRYHDPEFVQRVRGFIPLLASPDRHDPRDHDSHGRRIPDSKFGRLTNSEHITIEPELYARYFRGNRVAPRHVGVSPEGEILFDIYLINDFKIIDEALEKHGNFEAHLPDPSSLGEAALFAHPDAVARELLERRYVEGDETLRLRYVRNALQEGRDVQQPELLQLALNDDSDAVRTAAVRVLARQGTEGELERFPHAFRIATGNDELRRELSDGLGRIATKTEDEDTRIRARRLQRIFAARVAGDATLDADLWRAALADAPPAADPLNEPRIPLDQALATIESRLGADPGNAELELLFAATALRGAKRWITDGGGNATFLLQDAEVYARRALEHAPDNTLAHAYHAAASYLLNDLETAHASAARALPGLLNHAETAVVADVLTAYARTLRDRLVPAFGTDEGWPAAWANDIAACYEALLVHPDGTEAQARAGVDFYGAILECYAEQGDYLRRAITRYYDSNELHSYLRWQTQRDEGALGLLGLYEGLAFPEQASSTVSWYAGYARYVAAERLVEDGDPLTAIGAYASCIRDLQESFATEASFERSARHYMGLAHAGRARLLLDKGEIEAALGALRDSAQANAAGGKLEDSLGNSAVQIAEAISKRLDDDTPVKDVLALFE